jgi:hypothetical protein
VNGVYTHSDLRFIHVCLKGLYLFSFKVYTCSDCSVSIKGLYLFNFKVYTCSDTTDILKGNG